MFYGDTVGPGKGGRQDEGVRAKMGEDFKPSPLLEKLVAEGKRFQDLK